MKNLSVTIISMFLLLLEFRKCGLTYDTTEFAASCGKMDKYEQSRKKQLKERTTINVQ